MARVAINGNTYPVKDQLKELGARWDPNEKCWMVPEEHADEARALVESAPPKKKFEASEAPRGPRRCKVCGHEERFNARGFPIGDRIYRSGECQSCFEERKRGY